MLAFALAVWFLHQVWTQIPGVASSVATTEENVAQSYYRQGDFADILKYKTFVDKSLFIKYVFPTKKLNQQPVRAILAPRHFGKTVNLDMLHKFYAADVNEFGEEKQPEKSKYYDIFKNLTIFKEEGEFAKEHFAKYPVIRLDFRHYDVHQDYQISLPSLVGSMYHQHEYLRKSKRLSTFEKEHFISNCKQLNIDGICLRTDGVTLLRLLYKHYGKKVILLIDEFDAPALNVIFSKECGPTEKTSLRQLFQFFSPVVKNNEHCLIALFTGTTRVGEVASAEINILKYISIFDNAQIASHYGFTEKDIRFLAREMARTDIVKSIKRSCGGYKAEGGNESIYNPLSAGASLFTGVVKSYTDVKAALTPIRGMFKYDLFGREIEDSFYKPLEIELLSCTTSSLLDFRKIINKKSFHVTRREKNLFFQYMLEQGYYTYEKTVVKDSYEHIILIKIPNEEILSAFKATTFT